MKKIVVAEDDSASRELLCEMLQTWGYQVFEARDGAEALHKIEETKPDLVICDIQMPVLDGFGLVQALRIDTRFRSLPVIALTGFGTRDHQMILFVGFSTYQSKPINSEIMKKNVERLINGAGRTRP